MYPGVQTVSLRGDGAWRGMTTLATNERGDRRFSLLENVYPSSDGSELRTFPGWKTVVDFTTTLGESRTDGGGGYDRIIYDAQRPVSVKPGGASYYENITSHSTYSATQFTTGQRLRCFAKPTHLHGFKFVRGKLVVFGESDFRREPIVDDATGNTFLTVTHYQGGGTYCDLTLSAVYKTGETSFNAISNPSTGINIPVVVYISGTGVAALDDKMHEVYSLPSTSTVRLSTDLAVDAAPVVCTGARIYRVCRGSTLPGNAGVSYYSGTACADVDSLTTWELVDSPDVNSLIHTSTGNGCRPSWVANRQRDFADAVSARYEGLGSKDYSRRRQRSLPYRLVPDLAGERLLLAAPGYGCVFQVPRITGLSADVATPVVAGLPFNYNDIFDKPRCVGVPKAVLWCDYDPAAANSWHVYTGAATDFEFGGSDQPSRDGAYQFKVAYRDDTTGEYGLCSEVLTVTTASSGYTDAGIRLKILHPGYLMSESLALSVVVYRTGMGGSTFYRCATIGTRSGHSFKYGLTGADAVGSTQTIDYTHITFNVPYVSDANLALDTSYIPQAIEQMPMGAKTVETVRNHTFYGGAMGNSGPRREMVQTTLTTDYDLADYPYHDEVSSRVIGTAAGMWGPRDSGWGCAAGGIPPAYANTAGIMGFSLFPYPEFQTYLGRLVNTVTSYNQGTGTWPAEATYLRYKIDPAKNEVSVTRTGYVGESAWGLLERGLYQVSEANAPGQVMTHSQWVNAEKEEDIEAIGQAGGGVVLCTRSNTYYMNWSRTPFLDGVEPVQPDQVSAEFGCIAPNSMVEFDGGCAWISDRGPCAFMGGGVTWIGQDLERFFVGETSRYKRDSEGMMRHSWACHDAERGLVYFGVFADRESASITNRVTVNYRGTDFNWSDANPAGTYTADEANSRFPCDEVLIWSYRTNAWSRWVPPVGLEVLWMERGYDADGAQRVFFLAADWRIYALDDSYADTNKYGVELTLATAGSASSVVVTGWGTDESARDTSNAFLRVGMGVYIRSARGAIRGTSTIAGLTTGTNTITFADTLTWLAGDTLVAGARTATITSNWMNLSGEGSAKGARKLTTRYNLWGPAASTDSAKAAEAAVAATVTTNKRVDNTEYTDSRQVSDLTGELPAVWMGKDYLASLTGRTISMEKGIAIGQEMQVSMTIYHTSQVRVADLAIEAP